MFDCMWTEPTPPWISEFHSECLGSPWTWASWNLQAYQTWILCKYKKKALFVGIIWHAQHISTVSNQPSVLDLIIALIIFSWCVQMYLSCMIYPDSIYKMSGYHAGFCPSSAQFVETFISSEQDLRFHSPHETSVKLHWLLWEGHQAWQNKVSLAVHEGWVHTFSIEIPHCEADGLWPLFHSVQTRNESIMTAATAQLGKDQFCYSCLATNGEYLRVCEEALLMRRAVDIRVKWMKDAIAVPP